MARKSWTFRLFGRGRLPPRVRAEVEPEGLVAFDEGVRGRIVWHNYRAPGHYSSHRVAVLTGSIAVTERRLVACVGRRKVVDVAYTAREFEAYRVEAESHECLVVAIDVRRLDEKQSGTIEYRYLTDKAMYIADEVARVARIARSVAE